MSSQMATHVWLLERRRAFFLALLLFGGVLLLCWIVTVGIPRTAYKHKCAVVKQNLHSIQLAIERYAVDSPDNLYPRSIDEVIQSGYMESLPINPFTGAQMRAVRVTDRPDYGDFLYLQRGADGAIGVLSPDKDVTGYTLEAFF